MSIGRARGRGELEEIERLFAQVYPFARRSTHVRAAALAGCVDPVLLNPEDLTQTVLLGLWRALRDYDASRSSVRTFAEKVVVSTIASALRRDRTKKRTRTAKVESLIESVELSLRIECRIDIGRALNNLERLDFRVAKLLILDCKPAEIARKLRISRATVYRSMDRIGTVLKRFGLHKI